MATTADFRNGMVMQFEGELWQVVYFQHVKPGKGGAFVRTRLKKVKTGQVVERTFRAGERVDEVRLERRPMQYLYSGDHHAYFMDTQSYEQHPIDADLLVDQKLYLKENIVCDVLVHDGQVLGVELPQFIEAEIVETEPGFRGDTATGGTKPATLETGAVVQVPLFVNKGEKVRVDTRTNAYLERVK
ncbi:MAG TPA: elongation factor P [Gemmatimonadota bacterium]|nr:elongation factor P [Gemmatimonadota bacterium]